MVKEKLLEITEISEKKKREFIVETDRIIDSIAERPITEQFIIVKSLYDSFLEVCARERIRFVYQPKEYE